MNGSAIGRRLSGLERSKTEDVVPRVEGRIDYLPPVEPLRSQVRRLVYRQPIAQGVQCRPEGQVRLMLIVPTQLLRQIL